MMIRVKSCYAKLSFLALLTLTAIPTQADEINAIATVGDKSISLKTYQMELRNSIAQRFYHGRPPESELDDFKNEVADNLVERTLLLAEADRRGIGFDEDTVETRMAQINQQQNHGNETFKEALRSRLQENEKLNSLEAAVKTVADPNETELLRYYQDHPEKFTEPEQVRMSLILLKVDPSSPASAWEAAKTEANHIADQIQNGGDFAELANLHSTDSSAEKGGDMGYLHRGMLTDPVQKAIDEIQPGELTEPITVLEGIALFRLEERRTPELNPFEKIRDRAVSLWKQEQADRAWNDLLAQLREKTEIVINQDLIQQDGILD